MPLDFRAKSRGVTTYSQHAIRCRIGLILADDPPLLGHNKNIRAVYILGLWQTGIRWIIRHWQKVRGLVVGEAANPWSATIGSCSTGFVSHG